LQGYSGHIVTRLHTGWAHVYYVEITWSLSWKEN
jgi:hypothetical protein